MSGTIGILPFPIPIDPGVSILALILVSRKTPFRAGGAVFHCVPRIAAKGNTFVLVWVTDDSLADVYDDVDLGSLIRANPSFFLTIHFLLFFFWRKSDRPSLFPSSGDDLDLLFSTSTDAGLTWSPPVPLYNYAFTDGRHDYNPWISV